MRYLITFCCYGSRLHGDARGAVDRGHNRVGAPVLGSDVGRVEAERGLMAQAAFVLDPSAREVVLSALRQHCVFRGWGLLALHVRSNHVHAVVEAEVRPERVMQEFKAYASRALSYIHFGVLLWRGQMRRNGWWARSAFRVVPRSRL